MTTKVSKIKSFRCPKCEKYGLHIYNKHGDSSYFENKVNLIDHLSCLYCGLKIEQLKKEKSQ